MAGINANQVNPFLIAATTILKQACQIDAKVGKPSLEGTKGKNDTIAINICVTGEMQGQAMIAFENDIACDIASRMCMMPITEMDEISQSAICELGNMIMGNAATVFSTQGTLIDITPPTLIRGDIMFSSMYSHSICVPMIYEDNKTIEIHVAVKGND